MPRCTRISTLVSLLAALAFVGACDDRGPTAVAADAPSGDTVAPFDAGPDDSATAGADSAADERETGETGETGETVVAGDSASAVDAGDACVPARCGPKVCGTISDGCGGELACAPCVDDATVATWTERVDALIALLDEEGFTAPLIGLDIAALRTDAVEILTTHPAGDATLLEALYVTMAAFASGHSGVYSTTAWCSSFGGFDQEISRFDACARPHGEAFVVTWTAANNPLAMSRGDVIVSVNGIRGDALPRAILDNPLCGNGAGNPDTRREQAAVSLFSVLRPGDVLEVVGLDGTARSVVVGDKTTPPRSCRDPLGANDYFVARATLRADGVAVIRVPRFTFMPGDPRADTSDIDAYMAALTDIYASEFDKVRADAVAIVWDVRGNIGGASPVGFAIAGGMPGAHDVAIARCTTKIPGSVPPDFYEGGPDYDMKPDPRFAFDGPVAVLIDGLAISAADYFARAVRLGTDALLVGRPSAGAYGGGGAYESIYEPLGLVAAYDPYRCNDVDGAALETHSVEPDVWVEYAPADVAAGRDTVLETAVARLLAR